MLEETLRTIVAEIVQLHPDRPIDHSFEIGRPLLVDHGRLGQLFSNLISNAIAHGAPDQPIRTHASYRDGIVELWVANGGQPIADEDMSRLFQPFKRSGKNADGLGLGLFIASEIAKAHGGALSVASDQSETRFTLTIRPGFRCAEFLSARGLNHHLPTPALYVPGILDILQLPSVF